MSRTAHSFCRLCANACGVTLTIADDGRIESIFGDRAHPVSRGYACSKGRAAGAMHRRDDRILTPLKRADDGSFAPIALEQALDEIGGALRQLIDEHGPHAIGAFLGTTGYFNIPGSALLIAFLEALGSRSLFTSFTIDCSARAVTAGRLGAWGAGRQTWPTADVWMTLGSNPLVSLSSQTGLSLGNPAKAIKEAVARGMKLIVVDPRETETARYATVFLQPVPGEDAAVLAGMLRIILAEGLADDEFCARHVDGLERLRAAVEPFTPDAVAARAGVPADLLREAARVFGGAGKRGCAGAATGLTMSPHSNLVDHLVETLNVVCGRYVRAGETLANSGPLSPPAPRHAEVVPPQRPWERGYRSRAGGFGMIPGIAPGGEVPVGILADEILLPGEGQVRCLFVEGGNPAVAVPDQARAVEALASLELLVAVEPFMSATARLAHYIIPPKLMYERPDVPMLFGSQLRLPVSFSQYAPALVEPPPDAQVIDDWYLYWSLAKRLGLTIEGPGGPLAGDAPPTTDELIAGMLATAQVPLDELARHPHGKVFDDLDPVVVQPARPDSDARFAVLPDDVAEELRAYREAVADPAYPYRLTVRRMRHIMNSLDPSTPTPDENPAFLNPADMRRLGLNDGDPLEIVSDHARVTAIAETDERLRPGVVSISHCYGGLPGETVAGTCTNLLVDSRRHHQDINAMPTMSGLPVRLAPARVSGSATPAGACP